MWFMAHFMGRKAIHSPVIIGVERSFIHDRMLTLYNACQWYDLIGEAEAGPRP